MNESVDTIMAQAKAAARLTQILQRFGRSMNLKVYEDFKEKTSSFMLPGFKYDDFDRAGFVSVVKINRMMESSRLVKFNILGSTSFSAFMFSTHLWVSEQLYKNAAIDYPLKYTMCLSKVGKTSFDAVQSLVEDKTSTLVAQRICRVVYVDRVTKNAVSIPEEARNKLLEGVHDASRSLTLPDFDIPASIPERHFVHNVTVRFADLDFLFHSNQGSYLLYALECAAQAAAKGFYSKIHGDIAFYPAKTAFGMHVTESFAGDVLKVVTWENEENPMLLHFTMKRKDVDVYYGKVEFFSAEDFIANVQ